MRHSKLIQFFFSSQSRFNIFKAENIQRSLFPKHRSDPDIDYANFIDLNMDGNFSFSRFCDWSPQEMENIHSKGIFHALLKQNWINETLKWLQYAKTWQYKIPTKYLLLSASVSLSIISLIESNHSLIFTQYVITINYFIFRHIFK